ncbi:hypothetical protein TIFTF001_014053 [Ficus carica]|uniref:Uncharacterized protein n=1 Tax=Ficus carica TaxID=3494 RepID=A0AA88D3N7_FICCA|nr:hypothetical protein TIFTF001_014053 [Ficus carica]
MDAFTRMKIGEAVLTPIQLYGFAGECARAAGLICLPITIGDGPEKATRMMEFLVVNKPSIYNIIMGRPALNALKVVVSTYHLAMEFPTQNEVGILRGNQERARNCYVEVVSKVRHKVPQPTVVTTIFKIDEIDTPNGEIKPLSDLDPRMFEEEIRAQLVEDLVPYHLDHDTCHYTLFLPLCQPPPPDRTNTVLVTCANTDTCACVPPLPDWKGTWYSSSGGPTSVHPEHVYPLRPLGIRPTRVTRAPGLAGNTYK